MHVLSAKARTDGSARTTRYVAHRATERSGVLAHLSCKLHSGRSSAPAVQPTKIRSYKLQAAHRTQNLEKTKCVFPNKRNVAAVARSTNQLRPKNRDASATLKPVASRTHSSVLEHKHPGALAGVVRHERLSRKLKPLTGAEAEMAEFFGRYFFLNEI